MEEALKKELEAKLANVNTAEELQAVAREAGVEISLDDAGKLIAARSDAGEGEELSDDQLNAASGGVLWMEHILDLFK